MKIRIQLFVVLAALLGSASAHALYTELGLSYNYKKTGFGSDYKLETQASTVSVSFYAWEQIGLELAYTDSLLIKKEPETGAFSTTRTTIQRAKIYESNVQYLLTANRKAILQPFIKAGVAYTSKSQEVKIGDDFPFQLNPKPGLGPSYGIGAKIFLTESLSLRLSYDIVETPVDESNRALDSTGRVGISWML